jgi:cell division protein FtsB
MGIRSRTGRTKYQPKERQPAVFLSGLRLMQCLAAVLLLLCLLVLYGILFSDHGIIRYRSQNQQVEELEAKIRRLQEENQKLYHRIQSFKNDPAAQERLIREQLGWIRENELEFEFVPPKQNAR